MKENYTTWEEYIKAQQEMCRKYDSEWKPIDKNLIVGISDDISKDPLNALRHPLTDGTSGWYIWSGEFCESDDFFKPHCAEHLLKMRPEIIKYLALDVGYRFLIDSNGYEDVWFDESLKNV